MSTGKSLIIVGGGGFGREVIWLARECSDEWMIAGVLDDTDFLQGQSICEVPVIGKIDEWINYSDSLFIVAVGSPRTRKAIVSRMESKGAVHFATLVHPSVLLSKYVELGDGCIITAGCILTTQIKVGIHSIINLSSTIGHDVSIDNFCTLAPRVAVSGNVSISNGAEIGTGAILIPKISIGAGSFIGAGSVVTKNILENIMIVGSPARQIKTLETF